MRAILVAAMAAASAVRLASAATPALSTPYDCESGRQYWRSGWSPMKQMWCCKHQEIGCTFDCQAGAQNWEDGWSIAKQEWCCELHGVGCSRNRSYHYLFVGYGTAAEARSECQKYEGMPMPKTKDEQRALQAAVDATYAAGNLSWTVPNNTVWIGGKWNSELARWEWDDGTSIDSDARRSLRLSSMGTSARGGRPNGAGGSDQESDPWLCQLLDGLWHHAHASERFGIICKAEIEHAAETTVAVPHNSRTGAASATTTLEATTMTTTTTRPLTTTIVTTVISSKIATTISTTSTTTSTTPTRTITISTTRLIRTTTRTPTKTTVQTTSNEASAAVNSVHVGQDDVELLKAIGGQATSTSTSLAQGLSDDAQAAQGWSWLEFKPRRARGQAKLGIAQIAEIEFLSQGQKVDLTNAKATSPGQSSPFTNGPENAIDGSYDTAWVDHDDGALWIQLHARTLIDSFRFATASGRPVRDPTQWTLKGSRDGVVWTVLHQQSVDFDTPFQRKTFTPWIRTAEGPTCRNADGQAVDDHGYDCYTYSMYPSGCGNYDDEDFTASTMCCACGGGSMEVPSLNSSTRTNTTSTSVVQAASTTSQLVVTDDRAIQERQRVIGGAVGGSLGAVAVGLLGGLLGGLLTTETTTTTALANTSLRTAFSPMVFVNETHAHLRQTSDSFTVADHGGPHALDGVAQMPHLTQEEFRSGFHASWWSLGLAALLLVAMAFLFVGLAHAGHAGKLLSGRGKTRQAYVEASAPPAEEDMSSDSASPMRERTLESADDKASPELRTPRRTVVSEMFDALDHSHDGAIRRSSFVAVAQSSPSPTRGDVHVHGHLELSCFGQNVASPILMAQPSFGAVLLPALGTGMMHLPVLSPAMGMSPLSSSLVPMAVPALMPTPVPTGSMLVPVIPAEPVATVASGYHA